MGNARLFMLFGVSLALSSCTPSVHAPDSAISKVKGGTGAYEEHSESVTNLGNQRNFEQDMAIEGEVSQGCVEAWRKGLAHDEKGAMKQLNELGQKYPNVGTIQFMKGQVLDYLGKKEQAITFYKQAITGKEFSTMHLFKLAEALRKTHKDTEAAEQYKRLIASAPDFIPGRIGLAKSLLAVDKHSPEAREQLNETLKIDGDFKEAKDMLSAMDAKSTAGAKSTTDATPANDAKSAIDAKPANASESKIDAKPTIDTKPTKQEK